MLNNQQRLLPLPQYKISISLMSPVKEITSPDIPNRQKLYVAADDVGNLQPTYFMIV